MDLVPDQFTKIWPTPPCCLHVTHLLPKRGQNAKLCLTVTKIMLPWQWDTNGPSNYISDGTSPNTRCSHLLGSYFYGAETYRDAFWRGVNLLMIFKTIVLRTIYLLFFSICFGNAPSPATSKANALITSARWAKLSSFYDKSSAFIVVTASTAGDML